MKRRDFMKAALAAGVGGFPYAADLFAQAGTDRRARRPNVIFIMTDDQKRETFGFLREGKSKAHTPHIDSLVSEGVYFSRAYVSTSVCTPSRYTTLTGQYASRCPSRQFAKSSSREGQTSVAWNTFMQPEDPNLAKALKAAGYVTGFVGKGHCYTSAKYNKPPARLDPADPRVTAILADNQARQVAACKAHGFDYAASLYKSNIPGNSHPKLHVHNMDWTAKGALNFIEQNRDRPFFLWMATTLHHGPSPKQSFEKNDRRITEAGMLPEPLAVLPSNADILRRVRKAGCDPRSAHCTWLDDGIGAVLKKLDQLGLGKDTVVFYLNDQGMERGKGSLYEGGVHTPLMVRWKGHFEGGRNISHLVQNIDVAPTVLELCGAQPLPGMRLDGKSLLPLLKGTPTGWRDDLYLEIGLTRGVVTKTHKYIAFRIPPEYDEITPEQKVRMVEEYLAGKKANGMSFHDRKPDPDAPVTHLGSIPGGVNTEWPARSKYRHYFDSDQLYDLRQDPNEQNNLASDPVHGQLLGELQTRLKRFLANVPSPFGEIKPAPTKQ